MAVHLLQSSLPSVGGVAAAAGVAVAVTVAVIARWKWCCWWRYSDGRGKNNGSS